MEWLDEFASALDTAAPANLETVVLALLLAFVLGVVIAWTYMVTHSGLSYSRSFVQSLVVLPIILAIAMVVLALANSLVIAFGLMGAVAIVRFRNILKDTRDTAFLLLTLVIGLAVGTTSFEIGVIGTAAVCGVLLMLHYTAFGSRHRFDLILSFRLAGGPQSLETLAPVFDRHCQRTVLASERSAEPGGAADLSYRLLLRDPDRSAELAADLCAAEGVSNVSLVHRGDESEV